MSKKVFKITGSKLSRKVTIITSVFFQESLSDTESLVLAALINYSTNNALTITVDIGNQIKKELDISISSFSTSLYRLEKKGIYSKVSKTITFHPAFSGLIEMDKLVINFI